MRLYSKRALVKMRMKMVDDALEQAEYELKRRGRPTTYGGECVVTMSKLRYGLDEASRTIAARLQKGLDEHAY